MRVDSGVGRGLEVSALYDPMIAKVIVHGLDREHARRRMLRALEEYVIEGPKTLIGFHRALLSHQCFVEGETCLGLVESELLARQAEEPRANDVAGGAERPRRGAHVARSSWTAAATRCASSSPSRSTRSSSAAGASARHGRHGGHARDAVTSPMQGTVLAVEVADGDEVEAGQVICIVEAMKMENEISAHRDGVVSELSVAPGEPVNAGQVICVVTQDGDES